MSCILPLIACAVQHHAPTRTRTVTRPSLSQTPLLPLGPLFSILPPHSIQLLHLLKHAPIPLSAAIAPCHLRLLPVPPSLESWTFRRHQLQIPYYPLPFFSLHPLPPRGAYLPPLSAHIPPNHCISALRRTLLLTVLNPYTQSLTALRTLYSLLPHLLIVLSSPQRNSRHLSTLSTIHSPYSLPSGSIVSSRLSRRTRLCSPSRTGWVPASPMMYVYVYLPVDTSALLRGRPTHAAALRSQTADAPASHTRWRSHGRGQHGICISHVARTCARPAVWRRQPPGRLAASTRVGTGTPLAKAAPEASSAPGSIRTRPSPGHPAVPPDVSQRGVSTRRRARALARRAC